MKTKPHYTVLLVVCMTILFWGCSMSPARFHIQGDHQSLASGDILDTAANAKISFEQLIGQLGQARVVYVGERHNNRSHHAMQLKIIQALVDNGRQVSVGMEMFDHTYQNKLDRWVAGTWDWPTFLQQVHWYANWRYQDSLYKDILLYIQAQKLRLIGLNIPFCLPPKNGASRLTTCSSNQPFQGRSVSLTPGRGGGSCVNWRRANGLCVPARTGFWRRTSRHRTAMRSCRRAWRWSPLGSSSFRSGPRPALMDPGNRVEHPHDGRQRD